MFWDSHKNVVNQLSFEKSDLNKHFLERGPIICVFKFYGAFVFLCGFVGFLIVVVIISEEFWGSSCDLKSRSQSNCFKTV